MFPDLHMEEWVELQRACLRLTAKGDFVQAIDKINEFLSRTISPELRSEAVGFRGSLKEDRGDLRQAKEDFLEARALSSPGTYLKYTLELTLARLSQQMKDSEEAYRWYVQALETVARDPLTSGSAAISGLLAVREGVPLSIYEQQLCERVANQGWKLFSLPGEPDLQDLPGTVSILKEASTRRLPSTLK